MVDLETAGRDAGAAILSIGAFAFDPFVEPEIGGIYRHGPRVFHVNINLEQSMAAGFFVNGDTIMWWLSQSEAARRALVDPEPVAPYVALHQLYRWWPQGAKMWSHATFDAPIIHRAYAIVKRGGRAPWHYRDTRDVRTVTDLAFGYGTSHESMGVDVIGEKHDPVWDAINQARQVQACYTKLNGGPVHRAP